MITDFRINAKGELEGRVIPPAKWEEIYTKEEVIVMLTEIKKEIHEISTTPNTSKGFKLGQATAYYKCEFLIEQKINELREGEL